MKDWKKTLIAPDTPVLETMRVLDSSLLQVALVVDKGRKLIGTVTDGDIRRAILAGKSLDTSVAEIMNRSPKFCHQSDDRALIVHRLKSLHLHQMPILDERGVVVGLEIIDEILENGIKENWAMIMAGGLGSRLRPFTYEQPKPMLKVGEKPLLEIIIENLSAYGFRNFYISIHYKAELIKGHFGDGERWNANIRYVEEDKKLGTAGSLGLLPEKPKESILVVNGDLLTKLNYNYLFEFHEEHKAQATMCVREYRFQVPFGVVRLDRHKLVAIDEKPEHKFFVNAGIYLLEPEVLDWIDREIYLDMPALFEKLIGAGLETSVFPIREYWLDVGREIDLKKARDEYQDNFLKE